MPLISTGIFSCLMTHGCLRRSLSLFLVVSLLAPGLASAQPPPIGAQPPPPSGTTMRPVQQAPPAAPAPPRGTTPGPDYRLGPGDVLDVQIAGRLDIVRQQVVVDFVGAINAPPLGASRRARARCSGTRRRRSRW